MTPLELKSARLALGMGVEKFTRLVRIGSESTVRRWETGRAPIPGPVTLLLDLIQNVPAVKKHLELEP